MFDSLQRKLLKHEIMPPTAAWTNISSQLDEEFIAGDASLSSTLENTIIAPPPHIWSAIVKELNPAEELIQPQAKVLPIFYKRIAVAAVVVLIAGAIYFFRPGNVALPAPENNIVQKTPAARDSNPPAIIQKQEPVNQAVPPKEDRILIAEAGPRQASVKTMKKPAIEEADYLSYATNEIEAFHSSTTGTVEALQPIAVSAPLIRDASGRIIMDMNLINKPGQRYITVTSPNGNQTRISNKFLNCLSYINSSLSSDNNTDAVECKSKFEEWRNKLLSEAAFVPAANNFFDIFEMKDMIQD